MKKGVELSINFLVIMILGIAVLSGGIYLMYKVFSGANNITLKLSAQSQTDLDNLMDTGQLFALPSVQKNINKGKSDIFAIGINNQLGYAENFTIGTDTTLKNADNRSLNDIGGRVLYSKEPITMQSNERTKIPLAVIIPRNASTGTYIIGLNITVPSLSGTYGGPKRIYVVVK